MVDFDSDAQVPSRSWLDVPTDHKIDDCLGYKLAYATNHNKQNLKNIIDNHFKAEGGTCYSCGLQKAKQIYDNYTKDPNRLRVVLFLSDGEPYDSQWEIEDELQDLTNNYGAITSTFGIQIDNHVLRSMAEIGNGDFIHITNVDIPRLTSQVGRFYTTESIYRTNLASEQLYSWSEPYIDAMGMGAMITVSQPVWQNGQLKGVVGVDLTLDYLLEPVAHLQKTQAETGSLPDYYMTLFYLSTEYVISHPFVAIPSEKDATPVKLKQVEPEILSLIPSLANDSAISNDVYTKTFTRQSMNFHEHLVNSFGNGQDTYTAACKRIGTLDFALCEIKKQVTPVTIDRPTTDINDFNGAAKYGRYHRLDLYPRGSIEDDQCYHGYRVATKSSTFALPPKAFDFPVSYGLGNASFDKIQELHSLFNDNANTLTADWDMGPAKMKLDAFEDIKNSVRLTGLILNEHLNLESIKHVWRYFATIDGVMNVKPGVQLPNNYDPTLRPWFKEKMVKILKPKIFS